MSALVLGGRSISLRGRKPSRPAFLFDLHNDTAGGTTLVDRFGNAGALTLAGTLGAAWTTSRGFWQPNGTDAHAITSGSPTQYAAQSVMAPAIVTPGQGLIVAWRLGWTGTKASATEIVLSLGRSAADSASIRFGHNNSGIIEFDFRGVGASATTSVTFGAGALYVNGSINNCLIHVAATATGVEAAAFLNGVSVGNLQTLLWSTNGGSAPTVSTFAMPDGITLGANRGGTSGAPTFSQRVGAGSSGTTILSNVLAVNLAAANLNTAADLALELHQYPRQIGPILAAL